MVIKFGKTNCRKPKQHYNAINSWQERMHSHVKFVKLLKKLCWFLSNLLEQCTSPYKNMMFHDDVSGDMYFVYVISTLNVHGAGDVHSPVACKFSSMGNQCISPRFRLFCVFDKICKQSWWSGLSCFQFWPYSSVSQTLIFL